MNWRLIISSTRWVEALTTAFRIVLAASIIAGGWMGYRYAIALQRVSKLKTVAVMSGAAFAALRVEYDKQKREVGTVSHSQLVCDASAQFGGILADICRREGVRISQLQTEASQRTPLDNLEGGVTVSGWRALGHAVEIQGPCHAVHAVIADLRALPMPIEITGLEVKRVGLVSLSSPKGLRPSKADGGSLLRLAFTADVFEPGSPAGDQQTGGTS